MSNGLEAGRLGIARSRPVREVGVTVFALLGHEDFHVLDPFRGQQLLQMRRMARLSAGPALGLFLHDRRARAEGIGGRRQRGVGTVAAQPRFQFGDPSFQLGIAPLQLGEASITGAASRTIRTSHAGMLGSQPPRSYASFQRIR